MTLQDHVIEALYDFKARGPSKTLPSLVVIDTDSGNIRFLLCLVILQDYVSKGHVTLWVGVYQGDQPS